MHNRVGCSVYILPAYAFLLTLLFSQYAYAQSTILPTDTLPSTSTPLRHSPNNFELKLWEKLPSNFYFNGSVEGTFRLETNPYMAPPGSSVLYQYLPPGTYYYQLSPQQKESLQQELNTVNATDTVNRINPQLTAGWAFTPKTQIFANYFLLRDSMIHNAILNSTVQSVGGGVLHTITLNERVTLQPQVMMRQLWQSNEPDVTDILPGTTLQYQHGKHLVLYLNPLLQIRFRHILGAPMEELDDFFTVGGCYQRGRWTFLVSSTFNQNFRRNFGVNSLLPVNNYAFINDYEIDRQIFKEIPGLQAILRAEPIYNFHSSATNGLAGFDFRLYYGIRFSAAKPSLNSSMQQLMQKYTPASQY